ncbi:hypothetical protein WSK_3777 [Novosphingobium sp. Rr 2-17]|uniref:hypothetical protein n=1 Tax=Novosphingobium sp. Rr 2-17 TaxID=555793 RepID=UPI000269859A|nr:hypothetical protein [Novosphingobium sp. Rr 2-17]EIZ77766.1 hypothetical protein WSK_3777 [Novosphingobium sp. Rr 2-17]
MLDLTKPYTTQDVADLIASKDDSQLRQLRVTLNGIAFLSDEVGAENIDGLAFRFETWDQGNGYSGQAAAADTAWVSRIEHDLRKHWPNPRSSYIDF